MTRIISSPSPMRAAVLAPPDMVSPGQSMPDPVADFYAALNGSPAKFADALSADWILHGSSPSIPAMNLATYGEVASALLAGMGGFHYEILAVHVADDIVTVRGTVTATHTGRLFGVPATGRAIAFGAIDVHRLESGRIAESWHIEDFATVLRQIGLVQEAG